MPTFDEYGNVFYRCNICRDLGRVHPLKDDGRPDYSRTVRCQCRGQYKPSQEDVKQAEMEYQTTTRKDRRRSRK